tara:strand:+ start:330 stop:533 length:204 start_codon:yes stop_codon:yes gene_type:complete
MDIPADYIDWEEIWYNNICAKEEKKLGRKLTEEEYTNIKEELVGDPCDDCCCGGCGTRKNYPGEAHC